MRKSTQPPNSNSPTPEGPISGASEISIPRPQIDTLVDSVADVVYTPTNKERQLKAQFWTRVADNPLFTGEITALTARQILDSEYVATAWKKPGFKEWFSNKQEYKERIEYLFSRALDAAEEILLNQDIKAQSARVNMIKSISELASKIPSRGEASKNNGLAGAINQMDRAQLELLLEKNGVNVKMTASKGQPVDVHDVTPDDSQSKSPLDSKPNS